MSKQTFNIANRLYNGSCEHMDALPDESVSLLLTSPPYWVDPTDTYLGPALLRDTQGGTPQTYDQLLALLERCFKECLRVMRPGGVLAVNVASTRVAGRLYPLPFELALLLERQGWQMKEEILWRRWRGWDRRAGHLIRHPFPGYFFPNSVFEYVLVFNKPGPPLYLGRTAEEKEESRLVIDDLYIHETANNIWNILPVQPGTSGHPCPFPEELAYRLISLYSYRGDVVLDPFAGSGTTLKVARLLGRQWVGYEQNQSLLRLPEHGCMRKPLPASGASPGLSRWTRKRSRRDPMPAKLPGTPHRCLRSPKTALFNHRPNLPLMPKNDKPLLPYHQSSTRQCSAQEDVLHEQAVLCASITRLLSRALRVLEGQPLSFADRSRLTRALSRLQEVEQPARLPSPSYSPLPCSPE